MTAKLTIVEVEYIAHRMAIELLSYDENIPPFSTRYPNVLESCLATPFQTFGRKHLYRGLIDKAAIIFYLMNKNHPFQNGNKRIAVVTLILFLMKNGKGLKVNQHKLYLFAKMVAGSDPAEREKVLEQIRNFINKNLVDFKIL